jgi:hypothetical protein
MRSLLSIAVACFCLAGTSLPASAQFSFFNKRFCAQGHGFGRSPDCSFNTWEQCQMAARGNGQYCYENPNYRGDKRRPRGR